MTFCFAWLFSFFLCQKLIALSFLYYSTKQFDLKPYHFYYAKIRSFEQIINNGIKNVGWDVARIKCHPIAAQEYGDEAGESETLWERQEKTKADEWPESSNFVVIFFKKNNYPSRITAEGADNP